MFSPHQTSGFYCASATKGWLTVLIVAAVVINVPLISYKHWFTITYSAIFEDFRWDKYLASRCLFLDPKDVLCASVLLYHFRIFERRYGSAKFVGYLVGVWLLSAIVEILSMLLLKLVNINLTSIPTGPWGVVFALFVPYFCDLPRVAVTHIWGIPFTGKSITYMIGLQMMSSSLESIMLAACGILSGVLYRKDLFGVQSWLHVPRPISKMVGYSLGRLFHTPCPIDLMSPIGATLEIQRLQHIERLEQQMMWAQLTRQAAPAQNGGIGLFGRRTQRQSPEPSEDEIRQLVDMGFPRDRVVQALRQVDNNREQAASLLLSGLQ